MQKERTVEYSLHGEVVGREWAGDHGEGEAEKLVYHRPARCQSVASLPMGEAYAGTAGVIFEGAEVE